MVLHIFFRRTVFACCVFCLLSFAQLFAEGHRITGTITGYDGQTAILAMLYGGAQYTVDTALVAHGSFTFDSKFDLESGVYQVVLPPSTSFLILVDYNIFDFSFTADMKNIEGTMKFEHSPDNTAYYAYLNYFLQKKADLEKIKSEYDAQKENPEKKPEMLAKMQALKKEITAYQTEVVNKSPKSLTAALVRCELITDIPTYDGSPEEIQMKKYMFQKNHFFDNIDLTDERLIRAPKNVIVDRVDYYLDNLTVQSPDSINASVDYVLTKSEKTQPAYRFLLTHIFNKYREAKKIGMDAIYVHIAEDYMAKGKTPWIEEEERTKVLAAVKAISPTLIGKKAPDFTVQKRDGKDISLYSVQSPYTVLIFWSPNCTHCQQSMPQLTDFYNAYHTKGVEIFTVCTKVNEQEQSCWDFLDKNHFPVWINGSDKNGGSSMVQQTYNIKTTPKIYVLNKDKTIVAKDIGVENLTEVMKRLLHEK